MDLQIKLKKPEFFNSAYSLNTIPVCICKEGQEHDYFKGEDIGIITIEDEDDFLVCVWASKGNVYRHCSSLESAKETFVKIWEEDVILNRLSPYVSIIDSQKID